MSRSVRKPWYTDGYGCKRKKFAKRKANKKIRKTPEIPDGKAYRKFFNTWDICDYKYLWNPKPLHIYWTGELKIIEPDPLWKIARK